MRRLVNTRTSVAHLGAVLAIALAVVACGSNAASGSPSSTSSAAAVAGSPSPASSSAAAPTSASEAATSAAIASGDWTQFDYDAQRDGTGPADTGITAANLGSLGARQVQVGGIVDSAPIELHGIIVHGAPHDLVAVTTSYGRTIAFDAATGRKLWEFVPTGVDSTPGNPQVTTATPIADPDRHYLYSASPNGVIHKLSLASGRQVWATRITFDPVHEKIASSLNISGPYVVAVTGGYIGDIPPYDGHVVTIDRSSGQVVGVWNTECSNRHYLILARSCPVTNTNGDNAIWGRAGAVIDPITGDILVATGNGPFDGVTSWGDSVLELSGDASTLLHNWTPNNQAYLDANDLDLGSTSPAILPAFAGYHLAVQAGKAGVLDLLNLDRLDGSTGAAGPHLGGQLDQVSTPGSAVVVAQPAVWSSGGHIYVFVGSYSGTGAYELVDPAHPALRPLWEVGSPSTSPVVAGGLLYTYDPDGTLYVRRPTTGTVLRGLPTASGHWNSPIVVGGRIIEPTGAYGSSATSSTIYIYHLPGR